VKIAGSVALVSGANRGLGKCFATALLERGAAKVYAAARQPASVDVPGAVPLVLDVTDPHSVRVAAATANDVTLLVNNAGTHTYASLLDGSLDDIQLDMATHYYGTLSMVREFAPLLARNGGGAVLNVLSARSWLTASRSGAYSAAKAAAWSLTNTLRLELAPQRTLVTALHMWYIDTDMAALVEAPKTDPALVAKLALDGVEEGRFEVLADDFSRTVRARLGGNLIDLYPQMTEPGAVCDSSGTEEETA
jgi:NAD(P)-dependent dehydrogenase (short-subunit alcohol dehydrogenase family)